MAAAAARRARLEQRSHWLANQHDTLTPAAAAVAAAAAAEHPWRVVIGGEAFDNRGEAARALQPLLGWGRSRVLSFPDARVEVEWRPYQYGRGELAALVGTADGCIKLDSRDHDALVGALTRLTHAVEGLPHRLEALETEEADVELQLRQIPTEPAEFPRAAELREQRRRVEALQRELAERYSDEPSAESTASLNTDNAAERSGTTESDEVLDRVKALRVDLERATADPEARSSAGFIGRRVRDPGYIRAPEIPDGPGIGAPEAAPR